MSTQSSIPRRAPNWNETNEWPSTNNPPPDHRAAHNGSYKKETYFIFASTWLAPSVCALARLTCTCRVQRNDPIELFSDLLFLVRPLKLTIDWHWCPESCWEKKVCRRIEMGKASVILTRKNHFPTVDAHDANHDNTEWGKNDKRRETKKHQLNMTRDWMQTAFLGDPWSRQFSMTM